VPRRHLLHEGSAALVLVLLRQSSAQAGRGQAGRTASGGRGTSTVSGRTARPLAEAVCGVLRALRGAVTSVQSVLLVAFSPRVQELWEQAWKPDQPQGGRPKHARWPSGSV